MPRHVEAWMDGVALSSIGPILIQQVHEDSPTLEITNGERPGRYGQLLLGHKRQALKVTVEAAIRELRDLGYRAAVVEQMAAWAQGSVLELSNHPSRRLQVVCTGEPTLSDVRDYTEQIRMEFTAFVVPYWQDNVPERVTLSGSSGAGSLIVPGTVEAPVCVNVTPNGGTLTSLTVRVGSQEITLIGLAIAKNDTLVLERDSRDTLAIACKGVSQLSKRTAQSDDDLMAAPGRTAVSFTASTAASVTFAVQGRWA